MILSRRHFGAFLQRTFILGAGFAAVLSGNMAFAAPERADGGEVTFLLASLDSGWSLNEKVDLYTGQVWGQIADKLVHVDEAGNPTPWIATSWDINDDNSEFVLHLKEGVTFSDGTPLDAEAVAANIDIWARGDADRGVARLGLFPSSTYVGSDIIDPHTLRVRFSSPTLSFLPTLGYHKTVLRALSSLALPQSELGDLSKQIGSGPFVVSSWREGDNVVLHRRDDYDWGPAAIEHTGPASLDGIIFKVVKEAALRGSALEAGQADIVLNIPPHEIGGLRAKGFNVVAPDSLGFVSGFRVNTKAKFFDDVAVRRAIRNGIDRQDILDTVLTDDWKPAISYIEANVPGVSDFSSLLAYDPEGAKAGLDAAGWITGPDGIRVKNGERLRFTFYASPWVSTSRAVDELIVQQLRLIGIEANLQVVDVPTFNARARDNETVPLFEISRSFLDAGVAGRVLTNLNGGDNWFALDDGNTTLNHFATAIEEAKNHEDRAVALRDAQEYVIDQALFIPTTQLKQRLYVQSPKLHGDAYSGAAYPLYYGTWLEH